MTYYKSTLIKINLYRRQLEEPSFTVTHHTCILDMFLLYDSVKTKIQYWTGGNPVRAEDFFF